MPIYEYRCLKTGELCEVLLPLLDADKKFIYCPLHTRKNNQGEEVNWHDAEKIWSLPAPVSCGEETIVYKDRRTGETYIPSSKYEKLNPKRFEKVELKGSIARSKFENQENERNKISDEILTEKYKQQREASVKRRHEELKANLNSNDYFTYVDENTGETKTTSLDSSEKSLMKSAMDFTKNKKARKNLKRKTESKFVINHTDNSNLNK